MVAYYQRLKTLNEANPTTVLLLTGSALQPTEVAAIKTSLKEGNEEKEKVEGSGSQFCISILLLTDYMDDKVIEAYDDLDDCASGDKDIVEVVPASEKMVLLYCLSPKAFFKWLNSHDKKVDRIRKSTANLR